MHRRSFLASLILSAAAAAGSYAADTAAARPLRVLSYNIHHGEGVDGKLDLTRIAKVITDSGADLVALQEVDQKTTRTGGVDQAAEIARLTGLQVAYGKAIDYQGGAYGQALLSRWPLADFKVQKLPNPLSTAEKPVEQRIVLSATVRPGGGAPLRFVGTHLDAQRDDTARQQQAVRLVELFAQDTVPTLLLGDLNSRPETPAMKALFAHFTDASAATPAFTIPAKTPTARIDYVLLHPAGIWRTESSVVIPEAVASDHRPLLVVLLPAAK
jgi:endonuclease/exonuclease/phosphatase family metal-dependent hydrolase